LPPELKVLFTYRLRPQRHRPHGRLDPGAHLLTKPFAFEDLAARIRDILDGPFSPAGELVSYCG